MVSSVSKLFDQFVCISNMLAVVVVCFTLCGVCTYVGPVCVVCLFVIDSRTLACGAYSE